MARNVDYGEDVNLIPFNCYQSFVNEKGRLIKSDVIVDRIYCSVENVNTTRNNVNNVIRAVSNDAVFITNSQNKLEEDWYIENVYTKEIWKIQTITKTPINNGAFENSRRIHYQYRLGCVR